MRRAMAFSQAGLQMALTVGLGVAGGLWADHRWGGKPWGMLLGLFLGVGLGLTVFIRGALSLSQTEEEEKDKG